MAPNGNSRTPRDGDIRTVAIATVSTFGSILGFVLTMTFMGVSPWEAVGVTLAAGTATGTITRVLQDLLPPGPRQAKASAEANQEPVSPEPTEGAG